VSAGFSASGLRLGRVAGIPIRIAPSWFVIAAIITVLYAGTVARVVGPGPAAYAGAFGFALLLAASVLVHEATHAAAARSFGLAVDEIVVDLWGGHTSLGAPPNPTQAAVVAVLAPLANIALAGLMWVVGLVWQPGGLAGFLLGATLLANLLVGIFNLLPGLPLDGGRVLEAVVWGATGDRDRGTEVAGWAGRVVVLGAAAVVIGLPLLRGTTPSLFAVLWVVLLGATLWRAASEAVTVAGNRRRIRGVDPRSLTRPVVTLAADATVAEWSRAADGGRLTAVLVDGSGRPAAVVDPAAAEAVPGEAAAVTPVSSAAVRLSPHAWAPEGATTLDVVERLGRVGGPGLVLLRPPGAAVSWVGAGAVQEAMRTALRSRDGRGRS
jgi:Zn-dependent protease